ncbi:GIY-YIG nuclease family protein [bacterium]|nr:GIY-YIG nuclease family protein [bacterium]
MSHPRQSYQLDIRLGRARVIAVGRLGTFRFPAGRYVYTGSARRNLAARVGRHLAKSKRLRWHIDYLLACPAARVVGVRLSGRPECALNHRTRGRIIVRRFGASDCRRGCGSHLKCRGR